MEDVDQRSGNLLRAWREHRRMTQEALGAKIGTTGAVISLLEAGERKLSPKWLYKIAPVLGTTAGHLLDTHPEDVPEEIFEIWGAIPEVRRTLARDVLITFRHQPTGTDG
jgi:transcriptional regulator with XRE-family HTH domain